MTKEHLKTICDKYKFAEKQVSDLDMTYGICLWNSNKPNFYNEYNYIIFQLLEEIFGEQNRILIEEYLFDQSSMTFDELWDIING